MPHKSGRRKRKPAQTLTAAGRAPRRAQPPSTLWLYGVHAVLAALANPARSCRRLLVTAETAQTVGPRLEALKRARPGLPGPEIGSREAVGAPLPAGAVHQGISLLVQPLDEPDLGDICRAASLRERALVVALDQVEDPQNVGAVLRSCAAFGTMALISTGRHSPPETGALAKAASGALETVPLVRATNLVRALQELKAAGFWIAGLDAGAKTPLAEAGLGPKAALVLGAEGKGLRRLTRETCDLLVRLPIAAAVESLNVAAAAAIALYELSGRGADYLLPSAGPRAHEPP